MSIVQRWRARLLLALALLAALLLYRHFDLGQWLGLEQLQARREALAAYAQAHPVAALSAFFTIYLAVAALAIPGAAVLTLAGGAMFGLGAGVVVVSLASSLGALLACLAARYLLRDLVQARFGRQLAPIDEGIARDGTTYLLTLRLVPVFPFFLVNLLMGLTNIGALRFLIVSQIGMLPATIAYVNAGTQLATIRSTADVLSPALLASFALIGVLPLFAKAALAAWNRRRILARWSRPRRFDRNLVVIGAGAGGLISAYIAAAVRARVTLIEAHRMGGDCLNTGCVPSKALIRSARVARLLRDAGHYGLRDVSATVDFGAVMRRVRAVVRAIEPHDSVERYTQLGVEVLRGHARMVSPWQVEVALEDGGTRTLTTRSIVIAAGAGPSVPPIPGLEAAGFLTSDTIWDLEALPRRLVVLGGGPIGCELAQAFARLGSQVVQVEMAAHVLGREDPEVSELVARSLRADGVDLRTGHRALRVEPAGDGHRLVLEHEGRECAVVFDRLLCAVGRTPRTRGYGLEELGIELTPRGTIRTDARLRTTYPNIYAVGDVAGPWQLTHAAAHQAWYAAVNALFGGLRSFRVDERVMPWTTFTDPEVARVGLSETEARERGVPFEVTRYDLDDLDRAIADGTTAGFVKVLTAPGKDRILGVTIVGEHAGDLIAEYVLAMKQGLGLNRILATIHPYPTLAEANRLAAGQWKRAHAPERLLRWVARYHDWMRR